jgi:hypothetical protein
MATVAPVMGLCVRRTEFETADPALRGEMIVTISFAGLPAMGQEARVAPWRPSVYALAFVARVSIPST